MINRKIAESEMLSRFVEGAELLPPLLILERVALGGPNRADAAIRAQLPDRSDFYFSVEAKSQSTPLAVRSAITQARGHATPEELPLVLVPYLSPERLAELEQEQVSGIDLCGNGVIIVPNRLYVLRTGQPNLYPDSRPLSNPYRGRSAMVARMFLMRYGWESLGALRSALHDAGADLSLSQISKAVQALQDELILSKRDGYISLREPVRLLDKLADEWKKTSIRARQALRLQSGTDLVQALTSEPALKWALTGESSVTRYAMFSQGGPRRIAVSNLALAQTLLAAKPEPVPNFADVELMETDEAGYYFGNEIDDTGLRWASPLQTWLELQSGDGRQQDTARKLRKQILQEIKQ